MAFTTKGKLDELLNTLPEDPADQSDLVDLIGIPNDTDIATDISNLQEKLDILYKKNVGEQKVYPTLANSIQITSNASAWVIGNKVEIVPASTINNNFIITSIQTKGLFEATEYEIILYKGASSEEVEIGRCRIFTGVIGEQIIANGYHIPITTPILTSGTRISAAMASTYDLNVSINIAYILL